MGPQPAMVLKITPDNLLGGLVISVFMGSRLAGLHFHAALRSLLYTLQTEDRKVLD